MTKKQRNKETKKQEKSSSVLQFFSSSVRAERRGFTLIELLVVVAIIGILASIVIASLGRAREQGQNAKIKASLSNAKAQAELYYSVNGTYEGVCGDEYYDDNVTSENEADNIGAFILSAAEASPDDTNADCESDANSWVAAVELNSCACVSSADLGLIERNVLQCKVRGGISSLYDCTDIGTIGPIRKDEKVKK